MSIQETKLYDSTNNPISLQPITAVTVTKSDSTVLAAGVLYIGTTGDVKVTTKGGSTVTFVAVGASFILPVQVTMVWSTGTTASDMIILR